VVHKIFEFGQRQVREVMIPRPDMVAVDVHDTVASLLGQVAESGQRRFPVYEGELDNVLGFVSIRDLLLAMADTPGGDQKSVAGLVRPTIFVPETRRVGELFYGMQRQHVRMAAVIDEYGGTAGMVTLEELVEEIVGRLTDEWATEPPLVHIDERSAQVDGLMRVDEVNSELGTELPKDEHYDTVAGFVLHRLRRVPTEGEGLVYGDLELTVVEMTGPKIEKVLIKNLG
jgi:putative hemolysin